MRVAIIGSRGCNNFDDDYIKKRLPASCTQIISGGAAGIDSAAERLASALRIDFIKIAPDYERFGARAPLVRNVQIIQSADIVLAFWDFQSRGTAHALAECVKRRIPFRIYGFTEQARI